jgi:hypothetical protein
MTTLDPVRDLLRARGCADYAVDGGLDGLLEVWERVVVAIEGGYALGLDDYLNDLDVRELVAAVLPLLAERDRPRTLRRLNALDQRLRAATEPTTACLWGERVARSNGWSADAHWWYYARPRRPGPALRADLGER